MILLVRVTLLFCLASISSAPEAVAQVAAGPAPRNAAADAATYERCMNQAKEDPATAEKFALAWHQRGGKHPADHCAAVALIGLKKYEEAGTRLEALAQAMTTAPVSLRAQVIDQASQAWGLAGNAARAYAAAGAAVALLPDDPDLLIDRAQAAASAGYFARAVDDLDHVLKADPGRVDALIYRASANRALGRLDPALADIEQALAKAPDSVPALLERGNIRHLKGDDDGARQDWQRVAQSAPGSPAAIAAEANLEHLEANNGAPATSRRNP